MPSPSGAVRFRHRGIEARLEPPSRLGERHLAVVPQDRLDAAHGFEPAGPARSRPSLEVVRVQAEATRAAVPGLVDRPKRRGHGRLPAERARVRGVPDGVAPVDQRVQRGGVRSERADDDGDLARRDASGHGRERFVDRRLKLGASPLCVESVDRRGGGFALERVDRGVGPRDGSRAIHAERAARITRVRGQEKGDLASPVERAQQLDAHADQVVRAVVQDRDEPGAELGGARGGLLGQSCVVDRESFTRELVQSIGPTAIKPAQLGVGRGSAAAISPALSPASRRSVSVRAQRRLRPRPFANEIAQPAGRSLLDHPGEQRVHQAVVQKGAPADSHRFGDALAQRSVVNDGDVEHRAEPLGQPMRHVVGEPPARHDDQHGSQRIRRLCRRDAVQERVFQDPRRAVSDEPHDDA